MKIKHTKFLHEHYVLIRDISGSLRYSADEKNFCAALKNGPLSLKDAPLVIGKDMYTIDVSRLIKEGVIQMCGLMPTDIMHIRNDFNAYPAEASCLGAAYTAKNMGISVDELCKIVYSEIKRRIYGNIVKWRTL